MPVYRCCVGGCDNDSRYPDKIVKRRHVEGELHWHYIPKDLDTRKKWADQISKGLENFKALDHRVVCSNHFEYGKPTFASPIPTKYLIASDKYLASPKKRKPVIKTDATPGPSKAICPNAKENGAQCTLINPLAYCSLTFAAITCEHDVGLFAGLSCKEFELVSGYLQEKASCMHYWKGSKNAKKNTGQPRKYAQQRALTLEQEFFLCIMKLKLRLYF